jgi:IPT/TIG domain
MATFSSGGLCFGRSRLFSKMKTGNQAENRSTCKRWIFFFGVLLLATIAVAQNSPQVTGVDPAAGKVNDSVAVSGSNIGKEAVSAVYFSDDKNDYRATVVDQSDDKITLKVPQVKAGDYNISIQVGDKLFIKPVKFKVQE